MQDDIVIVSAARTPVGSFNGSLAGLPAHELGKVAIEAALKRAGVEGGQVSEVLAANPFFPPMMKHMVKAGESTGNVDGMMSKIADF